MFAVEENTVIATLETTLGRAKGKVRSRVWIEGTRLEQSRFNVGARYDVTTHEWGIALTLADNDDGARKVSGKPHSGPIIDITGAAIFNQFGHGDKVRATFCDGVIYITPLEPRYYIA
jgi:hypothetical protein